MSIPRRYPVLVLVLLCGAVLCTAAAAQPTETQLRIAIEDDPDGAALRLLDEAGPQPFPVAVRIELPELIAAAPLEARMAALERRQIPLWLAIPAPSAQGDIERWRTSLRGLLERRQSTLTILEILIDRQPAPVAVFAIQVAATEARARRAGMQTAIGGPAIDDASRRKEIYSGDLAPYVDLIATSADRNSVATWLKEIDPSARLALRGASDARPDTDPSRWVVEDVFEDLGTDVAFRAWRADDITAAAIRVLSPLASLLTHPVSTLDAAGVGLRLTIAQADVIATLRHRLLFDTRSFSTFLVYWGDAGSPPLGVSLTLAVEGEPGIHDVLTGERPRVTGYTRDRETRRIEALLPLTGRPMLVDFNEGAADVLVEKTEVSAARTLSVAEIISRHQQAQLTQDGLVRNYIASARMRQHFRPTITDAGYDVVTENRYFVEGPAVEWEELSFSVNGSKWETDRPPFPLLQPEKVLSLPLQLRFDEGYSYRLRGVERVDGFDCYVVGFEPVRQDSALYRGTVWIDQRTFARIRVHAVQGGLAAPVVSNEETHRYGLAATINNQPIFLFAGLSARQIVLLAGRNLLVEKEVSFSQFRVNDVEFERNREAARASERVMFRETEGGLRYYVKQGDTRVISETQTSRVKALAMGTYYDPSYAFPLPIFGINYLNFSFGGSNNTQLALLFGGVLAAGNIQRPKLGSTKLDASVDFFAIGVPSSDRIYGPGGEAESERVLTWPLSTGLNLGWQATPFQKVTLQYQLRFDAYIRDTTTAETFQPPSSTLTNGIGGAWEYRRGGYNVTVNGAWYARSRWEEWGAEPPAGQTRASVAAQRTYAKYSVGVARNVFLGPFQKFYVNAAWFGGKDLDRFAQYQFGMFDDTRIHGVPASGVRFAELAMVRGSYSLNIFEVYRLDVFLEHAWGRDEGSGTDWQPLPGVGAAVNLRAPWNTILRAEVGQSWLPDRYRGLGSTTLQVLLLKPLR
jgi:hypothetical protein